MNGESTNDELGRLTTGDYNGDGFDEIIIGGYYAGNSYIGKTYVFMNNATTVLRNSEGFRLLASPSSGAWLDELVSDFWTQGLTGADVTGGSPNVWHYQSSDSSWIAETDQTNGISSGEGFLMYLFSDDNGPGTSGDSGFPKYISVPLFGGTGLGAMNSIKPATNLDDDDFFFTGNPYPSTIDWDLADSTGITKINLSNTIYIYDDGTDQWDVWNGSSGDIFQGLIAPFQGFFVEGNGGSGELTIRTGAIPGTNPNANVIPSFKQAVSRYLTITAKSDHHIGKAYLGLQPGASFSEDNYDGSFLIPFSQNWLRLATKIDDGSLLKINALPSSIDERLIIPLDLSGKTNDREAKLNFEGLDQFEEWVILIEDQFTGQEYVIEEGTEITLIIEAIHEKVHFDKSKPRPIAAKVNTDDQPRYLLILEPSVAVSNEDIRIDIPAEVELSQNYPNPFNPSTKIEFTVPNAGIVQLDVFDVLGRKVAELVNEQRAAGRYTVEFNAGSLNSGVYFYRLQVGSSTIIQKMTLIK